MNDGLSQYLSQTSQDRCVSSFSFKCEADEASSFVSTEERLSDYDPLFEDDLTQVLQNLSSQECFETDSKIESASKTDCYKQEQLKKQVPEAIQSAYEMDSSDFCPNEKKNLCSKDLSTSTVQIQATRGLESKAGDTVNTIDTKDPCPKSDPEGSCSKRWAAVCPEIFYHDRTLDDALLLLECEKQWMQKNGRFRAFWNNTIEQYSIHKSNRPSVSNLPTSLNKSIEASPLKSPFPHFLNFRSCSSLGKRKKLSATPNENHGCLLR